MDSELQTKISRFEEWLQIGGVIKPENLKIAYFSQTGLGLKYEPSPVSKSTQKVASLSIFPLFFLINFVHLIE
jgi:hypothetical protein